MFQRGGPSFQSQGTGITSPYDTPRRGLVQYPGGYAGERTFENIQADREAIFAPKEGEQFRDVIESFGEYSNVRHPDGSFKTVGEQGYEQAKNITELRKEREDKTDPEYNNKVAAIEAEFDNISKKIIRGTPGMTALIQNAKDRLHKIHADSVKFTGTSFLQEILDQWNAKAAADNEKKIS